MKVSLKKAFSILDGRLSTNIDDVYEMLNYIFSDSLFTHQLPTAMKAIREVNPDWYLHGVALLDGIKEDAGTNDFNEIMQVIEKSYSECEIELVKIDKEILFSDGLFKQKK